MLIRPATLDDAERLVEIYRPAIEDSSISFELVVPSVSEFRGRIADVQAKWVWLVAEVDGEIAGYAYGGEHRAREAYQLSVETSAYVDQRFWRRGVAGSLYKEVLEQLTALGFANAYAGITLPNEASVGFHRSLGFEPIGVFPKVGRKFDQWHDVAWLHRPL